MKNQRKKFAITTLIACLLLFTTVSFTGCSTEFAKKEYDSDIAIAGSDRNVMIGAVHNNINDEYSLTASKFYGRTTCIKKSLSTEKTVNVRISLSITEGKAKVVYIDADKNVVTLIECTPDSSTNTPFIQELTMTKGQNIFKIVGYDCKDLKLILQIM